ncbi:hypothetical protein F5Y04DRAFT_277853 [Hypomontagnella monticulosa]|nr:hypothetical protein F5Y04DRAFT_277853 [Hypomontagnella monticulosa]
MEDNGAPQMPLEASSNMTMSMSTVSVASQNTSHTTKDPLVPKDNFLEGKGLQSSTHTLSSKQHMAGTQHDKTQSRENLLSIQRIQLAKQLSDERKLCADLEARLTPLQHELASLTSSNEIFEAECSRLQEQIDITNQQFESQAIEADRRDNFMKDTIIGLESKLEDASKSLDLSLFDLEVLQKAHDEAIKKSSQQADKVSQLDNELKTAQAKIHELDSMYNTLQEVHDNNVKVTIPDLERLHKLLEDELNQRLASKEAEIKELKKRSSKKDVAKARDQAQAESRKLQKRLDELEMSVKPFAQAVVICVDVSGSLYSSLHEVKQAYRDVLHIIKSNNSDAKVAVVIHGGYLERSPSPLQSISGVTFVLVDSISGAGGCEDYTYCLGQAVKILEPNGDSNKLVLLIGDGDAGCVNATTLRSHCDKLKSAHILAHSIIISEGRGLNNGWSMERISKITGGQIEDKYTYMSALDKLLRREREQHFKVSKV